MALLLTACILYIPANILPIMITDQLGTSTESTILGGVVLLINMGSIPIAAVIFIASVMVPVGKLMSSIIMSPGHAKRFLKVLSDNVTRYEQQYGEIKTQGQPEPKIDFIQ